MPWAHKYCSEWYKRSEGHEKTNHCDEYDAHQLRNTQAREHKENDKKRAKEDESYKAVTFDLEQVLITPWSNVLACSTHASSIRTALLYMTTGSKDVHCYMWQEGEGGRGSSEISTCVHKYLGPQVKHAILYSDTCGGQNRNAAFSVMCLHAVSSLPLSTIDHKYMESGHSQMECDSVHAAAEKCVSTPRWLLLHTCWEARYNNPYSVHELQHKDFVDFKSFSNHTLKNKAKDEGGQAVHWQKVKWFRYTKERTPTQSSSSTMSLPQPSKS